MFVANDIYEQDVQHLHIKPKGTYFYCRKEEFLIAFQISICGQ